MSTPGTETVKTRRPQQVIGVLLLLLGLLGHLLAAHLNGGSALAYQHHVLGFFAILAVTSVIVFTMERFLWRGGRTTTWLVIGAIQAVMGLVVAYLEWGAAARY